MKIFISFVALSFFCTAVFWANQKPTRHVASVEDSFELAPFFAESFDSSFFPDDPLEGKVKLTKGLKIKKKDLDGTVETNYKGIVDYYAHFMGEIIAPNLDPESTDFDSRFDNSLHWNKTIYPHNFTEEQLLKQQESFSLNVDKLLEVSGTKDLASAKRRYYSRLDYDLKQAQHIRPFYHLYGWGGLFHPPVKEIKEEEIGKYTSFVEEVPPMDESSEFFKPDFHIALDKETKTELTAHNELKLLLNKEAFEEKLRLIKDAKSYVFTSSLIYMCDGTTDLVVDELIKAKERGVEVFVIGEALTKQIDFGCVGKMRRAGIQVKTIAASFHKGGWGGVMHSKYWIRDGEEAILGGINMLKAENHSTGFNYGNRDTDVLVKKGPLVADLMENFLQAWDKYTSRDRKVKKYWEVVNKIKASEKEEGLRGQENYPKILAADERMKGVCRLASQQAGASAEPIYLILKKYIENSKKLIMFTTPTLGYNIEDVNAKSPKSGIDQMTIALKAKANEGVNVHIITNGFGGGLGEAAIMMRELFSNSFENSKKIAASIKEKILYYLHNNQTKKQFDHYVDMAKVPNVDVWQYFQYTHSKIYMFDRMVSSIGSFNFDNISADLSFETQVFCTDEALNKELEVAIVRDITNSTPFVGKNIDLKP